MTNSARMYIWAGASAFLLPVIAYVLMLVFFYAGWLGAGQVLIRTHEFVAQLGVNENTLIVQADPDKTIFPINVRGPDGSPYSGKVYGTIAGGSLLKDCVEWKGRYRNGIRHGVFEFTRNCYEATKRYEYKDGIELERPNSALLSDAFSSPRYACGAEKPGC